MEFKNQNSNLKIQDNKIISENKNVITKNLEYLTIKLDTLKGFEIVYWKYKTYIIYFCSLICFSFLLQQTTEVKSNGNFYTIPVPLEHKLIWVGCGLILFVVGYFFNKKYGNYYSLNIKYFEGKDKSSSVFTSFSRKELEDIEKTIKSNM